MIATEELSNIMAQCYGTENYYKMALGMKYTDGVLAFIQNAEAYWFVTDVALFKKEAFKANPNEDMFAVDLVVKDGKADLLFKDGDEKICYKRHYSYTTCPDGMWLFYYFRNENLLIWNGEY